MDDVSKWVDGAVAEAERASPADLEAAGQAGFDFKFAVLNEEPLAPAATDHHYAAGP